LTITYNNSYKTFSEFYKNILVEIANIAKHITLS